MRWMTSKAAGAPMMCGQSSKVFIATRATTAMVTAEPMNGTKPAMPISTPQMMALGKPSKARATVAQGGNAGVG